MATTASAVPGGSVDLALEGCTVVVTGAGSGIGAATARLLGAAGASVVLVGRREALLRQSAGAIEETGGHIALLLSPVSSFMTGAVIPVDGGQVIPHA
jgi:NAD(P)-dependent dehydrogenase (short-subunit alcohol dehydrogenase family)